MSYSEAKKYLKTLNIKNFRDYSRYLKNNKSSKLPSRPSDYYKQKGWTNWNDFLGIKR